MEHCSNEEKEEAKKLVDFYIDLVENNNSSIKVYLADNVVLDWFGKTVRDSKKVAFFLLDQASKVNHFITNTFPAKNVSFRDTHNVKPPRDQENVLVNSPSSSPAKILTTPQKQTQPSTSMLEMGQGDGVHNCNLMSPPKKMKLETDGEREVLEGEDEAPGMKYITAEGSVEFHKPSIKKLQTETKWRRPVKLHLGYTSSSFKDCTIYLIIYEGNLKCRRNLYKEFCRSDGNAKN